MRISCTYIQEMSFQQRKPLKASKLDADPQIFSIEGKKSLRRHCNKEDMEAERMAKDRSGDKSEFQEAESTPGKLG